MKIKKQTYNTKQKVFVRLIVSLLLLLTILLLSILLSDANLRLNASIKNTSPSLQHLFGTDWLGRDMLTRTVKGLRLSLMVGAFASMISVILATFIGICAAIFKKRIDTIISWFIDVFIGMPHLVFMILISFLVGGGIRGIVLGVSLTHWMSLARVIRAEVLQLKNMEYIHISKSYGKSSWYIARKHILPSVFPQIMVGFLLMFPHVILHEAGLTFLGFGLSPQTPAIGIILSEAMNHISTGDWWLVLFPGILLVIVIKSFDNIGEHMRILFDPTSANE